MNFSKTKYNDLLIYCAEDKSLCWAEVVSGPQVMALRDFAQSNGYAHYFGRTSSGNYYGVIDGAVRIMHEGEPHTIVGQYQYGNYIAVALVDLEESVEPAAVVDEPVVAPAVEQPTDTPVEEAAVEEQPAPSEPAQDEAAPKEEDVSQPDYKALYDDLVKQYNALYMSYANIRQAFDVIKQLLS